MASHHNLAITLLLLTGCAITGEGDDAECTGGKCDGVGDTCDDPRYGNGTCELQLECGVPDIDCFDIFEDDAAAATWFGMFEARLAQEEGRQPRTFLTPDDPRWAPTRDLLDRGWEAFKATRPVGALRDKRPGLVMLEDPTPNAFVAPNLTLDKAGFTVMVQTGLFETGGDQEGALGVMMHEFQHVVGLHIIGDTRERLRKFYLASSTSEPLGRFTNEDPIARSYGESWRTLAETAGQYYDERLGALPLGGEIIQVLQFSLAQAGTLQDPACVTARGELNALVGEVSATLDALTGDLTVNASIPARVDDAMYALKTGCFASFTPDMIAVMAAAQGVTPAMIEAALDPADVALMKGKHVVDGLSAFLLDRRAKMRQLESELASNAGQDWDHLRYFSDEEDADDVSVYVLRAANVGTPYAIGGFMTSFLPADAQAQCIDMLQRYEVPPYGHDLSDAHHSHCWRAHHARQLAAHLDESSSRTVARATATASQLPSFPPPRKLPLKRRLRDHLAY